MQPVLIAILVAASLVAVVQATTEGSPDVFVGKQADDNHYDDDDDDYYEIEEERSQKALFASDDEEVEGLAEPVKLIYKDYCLRMRDHLKVTFESKMNEGAAKFFELFMDTGKAAVLGALRVEETETEKAIEQLKNGELVKLDTDGDGRLSVQELEKAEGAVDENGEPVQVGILTRILGAINVVFKSMSFAAMNEVNDKVAEMKRTFKVENLGDFVDDTCRGIDAHVRKYMEDGLNEIKKKVRQSRGGSQSGRLSDGLDQYNLETLGCLTTTRVARASKACKTIRSVVPLITTVAGNFMTSRAATTEYE